jgi:hypothetical protein
MNLNAVEKFNALSNLVLPGTDAKASENKQALNDENTHAAIIQRIVGTSPAS